MSVAIHKPINQYGLTEIYSASNPQVDIVLVHGLNGHPHNTWATTKPDVFWPVDLLPAAIEDQKCRILTYGYDANVTAFTHGTSKDNVHNHAEHLASRLVANRSLKKALERPIIFVCHSLGGLVVKRCLIYCESVRHPHTERLRSVYVSTYGILFLGTPHNGSDLAKWGSLLQSICAAVLPKKFFDSSPQLIQALKTNNETLQNINRLFVEIIGRFRIYFFHESKPMNLKGTLDFVVDEDSAAPVIEGVERMGIERDHSNMCKFEDENAPGYDVVAEAIQRYATDAPQLIESRWEEERRIRVFERQGAARELLGDSIFQMSSAVPSVNSARLSQPVSMGSSTSSVKLIDYPAVQAASSSQLLIAPLGFRPNSVFLGFQFELDQVTVKLQNQKRRAQGTSAVLIWGPPGCGKTHLAREYLWRNRSEYLAGVYWVDCKSAESRSRSFWDIGQAVAILGVDVPRDPQWDESTKFVDAVRRWFESREGWLLVFDGVSFDNDSEIQEFLKFIPDSRNNSIIFTSVDKTLANRQRLLNPTAIKVHSLSQEDACELLYKSLGLEKPNSAQSKKATQLVKRYDCLPLAIHAAAHVLIARGRDLEKYSPGVSDHRLAEPFIEIMSALLDHSHNEAANLVNILSFFSHTIPVALLHLGRTALNEFGVEIRSVERLGSTKKELDNTIATLIRYGLVERTLLAYSITSPTDELSFIERSHHSNDQTPSTSIMTLEEVKDPPPDDVENLRETLDTRSGSRVERSSQASVTYSIDILRIHTVVQSVLRDELRLQVEAQTQRYHWWLAIATRLLCQSYAAANEKIKADSGQGLVRDYREYETHAARLWTHFPKSAKEAPPRLRKARHQLHETLRAIRHEIKNRSPSHSFNSIHHRVQASIFERSSSSSDNGPETPTSSMTRASTWSLELSDSKTESPTQLQGGLLIDYNYSEDSWTDREMDSSFENLRTHSLVSGTRRSSRSDATEIVDSHQRRPSILQAIFQGRPPQSRKQRDLGEWKPAPAPPSLSHPDVQVIKSRDSSVSSTTELGPTRPISAGSEAEAALAAVHKGSPPATRGGQIRSPSRGKNIEGRASSQERYPLSNKSPNVLSPLTAEFDPNSLTLVNEDRPRKHSRNPSSPRLFQAVLSNQAIAQASKGLPVIPVEESITITRRRGLPTMMNSENTVINLPLGYTSQPMSRDNSRDSDVSLATAPPAIPGSASLSASPQIREPYLYSRPGPASIDVVAARSLNFGRMGDWASFSPTTPQISGINIDQDISENGRVQFGQMEPVGLQDARARADAARETTVEVLTGNYSGQNRIQKLEEKEMDK